MAIKNRRDLEGYFKKGIKLSEKAFLDLIESSLIKRDDQFYGKWQEGVTYRREDVVIYGRSLWILHPKNDVEEICSHYPPDKDAENWESLIVPIVDGDWFYTESTGVMYALVNKKVGIGTDVPTGKLDLEEENRGRFIFNPEGGEDLIFTMVKYIKDNAPNYLVTGIDKDVTAWLSNTPKGYIFKHGEPFVHGYAELDIHSGDVLMVIQPDENDLVKVGIGTSQPGAMLDITDGKKGQFLFNPQEKCDPAFTIVNLTEHCDKNYMSCGVGPLHAVLITDAPNGLLIKKGKDFGIFCSQENINQGDVLVSINQNADLLPRVGIGTDEPEAMLDITSEKRFKILFNPGNSDNPFIVFHKLSPEQQKTYFIQGIENKRNSFVTNAQEGFVFKAGGEFGIDNSELTIAQGKELVSFLPNGYVGIGTAQPSINFEITNKKDGRFLFNLDKNVNPSFSIVNSNKDSKENYLLTGASKDAAIFVTDSSDGFIFKKGNEAGNKESEIDIIQGKKILSINFLEKGRLSIGERDDKIFELDVWGQIRAYNLYLEINEGNMIEVKDLTDVLTKLNKLSAVKFKWSAKTGLEKEGEQIGLLADQLDNYFPQVVKKANDGSKSIAYQNLIPVIIQGIKEFQQQVNQKDDKITSLEARLNLQQKQLDLLDKKLSDLSKRLDDCCQ